MPGGRSGARGRRRAGAPAGAGRRPGRGRQAMHGRSADPTPRPSRAGPAGAVAAPGRPSRSRAAAPGSARGRSRGTRRVHRGIAAHRPAWGSGPAGRLGAGPPRTGPALRLAPPGPRPDRPSGRSSARSGPGGRFRAGPDPAGRGTPRRRRSRGGPATRDGSRRSRVADEAGRGGLGRRGSRRDDTAGRARSAAARWRRRGAVSLQSAMRERGPGLRIGVTQWSVDGRGPETCSGRPPSVSTRST